MDEFRMFFENDVWELCFVKVFFKIVDFLVSRNLRICVYIGFGRFSLKVSFKEFLLFINFIEVFYLCIGYFWRFFRLIEYKFFNRFFFKIFYLW